MKDGLFTDEELGGPEPQVCPCSQIRDWQCEGRNQGKLIRGRCIGSENYTRCPSFSAWYWHKVAKARAKADDVRKTDKQMAKEYDW